MKEMTKGVMNVENVECRKVDKQPIKTPKKNDAKKQKRKKNEPGIKKAPVPDPGPTSVLVFGFTFVGLAFVKVGFKIFGLVVFEVLLLSPDMIDNLSRSRSRSLSLSRSRSLSLRSLSLSRCEANAIPVGFKTTCVVVVFGLVLTPACA